VRTARAGRNAGELLTGAALPHRVLRLDGVWLSLVERCVRDAEVGGSNPLTPTTNQRPALALPGRRGSVISGAGWPGRTRPRPEMPLILPVRLATPRPGSHSDGIGAAAELPRTGSIPHGIGAARCVSPRGRCALHALHSGIPAPGCAPSHPSGSSQALARSAVVAALPGEVSGPSGRRHHSSEPCVRPRAPVPDPGSSAPVLRRGQEPRASPQEPTT
jgi:hypothetical protein